MYARHSIRGSRSHSDKSVDILNNLYTAVIHILQKAMVVLTKQKSQYTPSNRPTQKLDAKSGMHRHVTAVRSSTRRYISKVAR